eukprot:444100-Pyramimonas_sp.AAC.1
MGRTEATKVFKPREISLEGSEILAGTMDLLEKDYLMPKLAVKLNGTNHSAGGEGKGEEEEEEELPLSEPLSSEWQDPAFRLFDKGSEWERKN